MYCGVTPRKRDHTSSQAATASEGRGPSSIARRFWSNCSTREAPRIRQSTAVWCSSQLSARLAGGAEARLLAVRRGAPLLTMSRTAFDDAGQPVELGLHIYPAERYSLEMTVVRH